MHAPVSAVTLHSNNRAVTNGFVVGGAAKAEFSLERVEGGTIVEVGNVRFMLPFKYRAPNGKMLVCVSVGLPAGMRLAPGFKRLWAGVLGDKLLARNGQNFLLEVAHDQILSIFYEDGRHANAGFVSGRLVLDHSSPEGALRERLAFVEKAINKAASSPDKQYKDRCVNGALFHLCDMLRMTTLYPAFRREITSSVGRCVKHAAGGRLDPAKVRMFSAALRASGDSGTYWWLGGSSNSPASPQAVRNNGRKIDSKSARRLRDQEFRALMKGPPRNDDTQKHGNKKKK